MLREVERTWVDLKPKLAFGKLNAMRVIDVRSHRDFGGSMGVVRGCENVPLASVKEAAQAWDRDEPVLVVCRYGQLSELACARLRTAGFTRVFNLEGGLLAWLAAGFPTET